ncbi:Guanosine-3',5'-bis(diphosphate) 3'-pyrophosphohydrolase MESH1 [Boothiomyces sp. JEL0866]|nr:Guanosine-3',5'-bis(diphosphate) 3'-pyrophosphohydrolase MESH1 [Boothiomyces sp. JEL0866]
MELEQLLDCIVFAAEKHRNQRRKDSQSTPYINHPLGVAHILIKEKISDIDILRAAILHDTVEDTETTFEELLEKFGPTVTDYVREVTDDKTKPKQVRKQLQIETGPHKSYGAKLVKMADKINNLRDLEHEIPDGWDKERADQYFIWAKKVTDNLKVHDGLQRQLEELYARNIK